MIAIDTNVLVRFFIADDPEQHQKVKQLFNTLSRNNPAFISQPVLLETYWVLSRSFSLSKQKCLEAFWALALSEEIEFDDAECFVEALHASENGADFADALIEANAKQFNVSKCFTFEKAAAKNLGWSTL